MKFNVRIKTFIYGRGEVKKVEEHESLSHYFEDLTTSPELMERGFNNNPDFSVNRVAGSELTKCLKDRVAFIKREGDALVYGFGSGGLFGGLDKEVRVQLVQEETGGMK